MADPTLKDVLEAIARLERNAATKSAVARIESDMATKSDLAELNAMTKSDLASLKSEMGSRFDRIEKRLDDLDRDLTKHMDVHRELEKDITQLKRRPPRTAAGPARRRSR